jgi:hypothetical protein
MIVQIKSQDLQGGLTSWRPRRANGTVPIQMELRKNWGFGHVQKQEKTGVPVQKLLRAECFCPHPDFIC